MRRFPLSLLRALVLLPSLALVLLIRVLKWLVAPFALLPQVLLGVPLVLLRLRQPLRLRLVPIQEADLPDAAWITLTDAAEALAADAFVHYGDFRCDGLIQNAVLWLRLLGRPEPGIGAIAAHIAFGGSRPAHNFIEFITEFHDGRVLTTNNLNLPYSLPAPNYLARLQLKDVWDARALYVLHRDLVAALGQPIRSAKIEQAARDPANLLIDSHAREIQALIARGWLRPDPATDTARLSLWGALVGVWRQAWSLAGLHLRAADRRARRLLAEHGIDATAFVGGAPGIVVARQPLPVPVAINTARAGYERILPLAQRTDPRAVLEAVVVELDQDHAGALLTPEFRYTFRGCADHHQRRIRRLRSFDIVLDLEAAEMAVTAMEREFEQVADETEWAVLVTNSPLIPLTLGPPLHDLDQVLPVALATLAAQTETGRVLLDSASLYSDEGGIPCWQVVAWNGEDDPPLHVRVDARSGVILPDD